MYKLQKTHPVYGDTYIVRLSDGQKIVANPKNEDYIEYTKWIKEGNEPEK